MLEANLEVLDTVRCPTPLYSPAQELTFRRHIRVKTLLWTASKHWRGGRPSKRRELDRGARQLRWCVVPLPHLPGLVPTS